MSVTILKEFLLFLETVGMGAFFVQLYLFLLGFRSAIVHSGVEEGIEEVLFWLICSYIFFRFVDRKNYGVLRIFMFVGMALGIGGSWRIFHSCCLNFWIRLWRIPIILVKKMRKRLLFLIKQCKISMYKFTRLGKKGRTGLMKLKRGYDIEKPHEGAGQKDSGK